jgi:hypothetical protein
MVYLKVLYWDPFYFYYLLAEMPGVARVDHRAKCVSLVAISLSQNFETRKQASSSLLLAFASMVILGVEPHRDP